jgi:hypothetical protein
MHLYFLHLRVVVYVEYPVSSLYCTVLYCTLIPSLSCEYLQVTSNAHAYFHATDVQEFEYDINHLLHASTILFTFAFGVPIVLWVTTQCMNMHTLLLVDWVCYYGYSLVSFLPIVFLCAIPWGLISWLALLVGTIMSGSLVVRNVTAPLLSSDVGLAKAPPLILAILGSHVIFLLFMKFTFYHH